MIEKQKKKDFEEVVTATVSLFAILKSMNIHDHTGEWLQFLHWDLKMDEKQKQARLLMDKIIQQIQKHNGQISARLIYSRVVYELLAKAIWFPGDYPDFSESARQEIKILFEYAATRNIDIPLAYLIVQNQSKKFGLITIYNMTNEDYETEWWKRVVAIARNSEVVRAYARVNCVGDLENSLQDSRMIVADMLIFLRAIGFPITIKNQHQFGILNEYSSILALPSRIDTPKENHRLEYPVNLSTSIGPGGFSYELEKVLLSQINAGSLDQLQKIIEEDYLILQRKVASENLKLSEFFLAV